MCAHLQRGERAEKGREEEVSWRRERGRSELEEGRDVKSMRCRGVD